MSYLRMYREDYIKENDLDHMYINHTRKFVTVMEGKGFGDKIIDIGKQQLKDSVAEYSKKGDIKTVSTMDNHLNAIKNFFVYLHKNGKAKNIFNEIPDYNSFRQEVISENNLKPSIKRGLLGEDQIKELLEYFNSYPDKYVNMTMFSFFFKISLLAPAKRKVIANLKVGDFSENFSTVRINGNNIKLPRALSVDIQKEIVSKEFTKDNLFFELFFNSGSYTDNVFNAPFYYALKEIGYNPPKKKNPSYPVEVIRNTVIVNLFENGTDPNLIVKLTGQTLDTLSDKLEVNIDFDTLIDERINGEICKLKYYQDI